VSIVRTPACLAEGIGLLATVALVPFVSHGGITFMPTKDGLSLTALALANQQPLFWILVVIGIACAAYGFMAEERSNRAAVWGGLVGCFLVFWLTWMVAVKPYAFGPGALLSLGICLLILGRGLSRSGFIRADTFVAVSILLVSLFIILFILLPLFAILRQSMVDGSGVRVTLLAETLKRYPSFWRVLGNSLGLAVFVSCTSTLIGLVFALAATRSRSRFTGLLRAFSLLPIITPPFVVGMAIILLFGLQGFVTSQLMGLKTEGSSVFRAWPWRRPCLLHRLHSW